LSGLDVLTDGHLIINIKLEDSYDIIIMVSYSQKEEWKFYDVDISTIYNFVIDEKYVLEIDGDNILKSREEIAQWQIVKYKSFNLNKGIHTLSIYVQGNKEIGTPNIDYIDFFNYKSEVIPIYLDSDGKPSNDFHTSLQYRYLTDENVENIFSYATGSKDLSRPQGNILNFTDSITESSNSYIIQISSSLFFNTPDTKIIKDLKEKYYTIKNLKLGQKIFYRGAINELDLINSKIYIYTVNNIIGLRNVEISGVDNSRDIGGYKTSLVENGTINQGLYYRTAQLDDITTEGKKILRDDLGVKVEIDLRDSRYNKNTDTFEEIPDSDYVYTFEVASDSFNISDSWSDYSGEIFEKEISNSLPNGHWHYIKKHGLPKEEGTYLVSSSKEPYAFTAYFNPETVCEEDYCEGFFDSPYMEYEIHSVYAWTEMIKAASK
jgi:hypothetical protein